MLLGFWFQLQKGADIRQTPIEEQLLTMNTVLLQVEPLTKEQPITVRASLPIKGWTYVFPHLPQPWLRLLQ